MLHCIQGIWRRQTLNSELQRPHYIMSQWSVVLEMWMMRVWQLRSFEDSTIAHTIIYTGYYTWYSASMDKNGSFWVTSTKSEPDALIKHTEVCFKLKENYELSHQNWYSNENSTLKVNWSLKSVLFWFLTSLKEIKQLKNKTYKKPETKTTKSPIPLFQ